MKTDNLLNNLITYYGTEEQKETQAKKLTEMLDNLDSKFVSTADKMTNMIDGTIIKQYDADTFDIADGEGNVRRFRTNTGVLGADYDAIDDKETILKNPNKSKTQIPFLEKVFNKPFEEITDEEIQNYKNYQSEIAYINYSQGRFGQREDGSNISVIGHKGIQYDINGNPITDITKSIDIGNEIEGRKDLYYPLIHPNISDEELNYIKRNPSRLNNLQDKVIGKINEDAKQYALEQYNQGKSAFYDEDINKKFDPNQQYNFNPKLYEGTKIKYEDLGDNVYGRKSATLYNPFDYKMNTKSLSTKESQNVSLNLQKLNQVYQRATDPRYKVEALKESEQSLGEYLDNLGKNSLAGLNRAIYGVYEFAETNNIPVLPDMLNTFSMIGNEGAKSYRDVYNNPELKENINTLVKLSQGVTVQYIKDNERKMNDIMTELSNGNYLSAFGKGLIAIPELLSDSVGEMAIGGIAATGGAIAGLGKIGTLLVSNSAITLAQLGNVMNEYEKNNGKPMSKDRQLFAFTGLFLSNILDVVAIGKGGSLFFKNTFGKQILKESSNLPTKQKSLVRKMLTTNAVLAGTGFAGEAIQENIQESMETYFSQNLQDAKTFLEIATSDESLVAGMLGGIVGGSLAYTGKTISDLSQKRKEKKVEKAIDKLKQKQIESNNLIDLSNTIEMLDSDSELLNKKDLSEKEFNNIKTRIKEIYKQVDNGDLSPEILSKANKLMSKTILKDRMMSGKDLDELMNDKDFNPDGESNPEELLLKLYYYSDKNNKEEQKVLEEIKTKNNIDIDYKDYDKVDLEAKFGDNGYITYRENLKYYTKQLNRKDLSENNKKYMQNKINGIEMNLDRFNKSQYTKLKEIIKGITQLANNENLIEAKYNKPNENLTEKIKEKKGFIKRDDFFNYNSKDKVGGIYKILNATIQNIEDTNTILKKYTQVKDVDSKRRKDLKSIKNNLNKQIEKITGVSAPKKNINIGTTKHIKQKDTPVISQEDRLKQKRETYKNVVSQLLDDYKNGKVKLQKVFDQLVNDVGYTLEKAKELTDRFKPSESTSKKTSAKKDTGTTKQKKKPVETKSVTNKGINQELLDSTIKDYKDDKITLHQAYNKLIEKVNLSKEKAKAFLNPIFEKKKEKQQDSTSNEKKVEKQPNIQETKKDSIQTKSETNKATYEVSSKGDKRFSAFNARFKPNTKIELVNGDKKETINVSDKSIEFVYQTMVKKSKKGMKPNKDSILYNPNLTKEQAEDLSYNVGYLPLWKTWAKQNLDLITELKKQVDSGKTLVDSFAKTKVNQARALSEIIDLINKNKNDSVSTKIHSDKPITNTAANKNVDTESTITNKLDTSKPIILHSGGAYGADTYFSEVGKKYGIESKHYYLEDKEKPKSMPPNRNTLMSNEDLLEAKKEIVKVARRAYGFQWKEIRDKKTLRDYSQAKYADSIFVVGSIVNVGDKLFPSYKDDTRKALVPTVTGGAMYAFEVGKDKGIPLYVFDQNKNSWFKWDYETNNFIESSTPTITNNFAGIGTRNLKENGKKAIEDLYANSFAKIKKETTNLESDIKQNDINKEVDLDDINSQLQSTQYDEYEPSDYVPISTINKQKKDNKPKNIDEKELFKDIDIDAVTKLTSTQINKAINNIITDVEVVDSVLYTDDESNFTITEKQFNIQYKEPVKDKDGNYEVYRNNYITTDNIVKTDNYKPFANNTDNVKYLYRSKYEYDNFINKSDNIVNKIFNGFDSVFKNDVDINEIASIYNESILSENENLSKELKEKLDFNKDKDNKIKEIKEQNESLYNTQLLIKKYILKPNNYKKSTEQYKKEQLDIFKKSYLKDDIKDIVDLFEIDLNDTKELYSKVDTINRIIQDNKKEINNLYNEKYDIDEIKTLKKEINKNVNKIDSNLITDKLNDTNLKKSLEQKQNDNNIDTLINISKKLKPSKNKESLFSMFSINKNNKVVNNTINFFLDTFKLNDKVKTIESRMSRNEPALALLFNKLPKDIDYLSKEKLNEYLDTNVIMAIDYSVAEFFSINRNSLKFNEDKLKDKYSDDNKEESDIKRIMSVVKQMPRTSIINKMGDIVVKNIGITTNNDSITEFEWNQIKGNLGLYAYNYALQNGYLLEKETTTIIDDRKINITFVSDNTNKYNIDYLKAKYELFGLGSIVNKTKPLTSPEKDKKVKVRNGSPVQEPTTLLDLANEVTRRTGYYADVENIKFCIENEALIKRQLGYTEDLDSIDILDERIECEGKNQSIDQSFEQLKMVYETYNLSNPIYFKTFSSRNGRIFIDSNTINPQTNKLDRFLFIPVTKEGLVINEDIDGNTTLQNYINEYDFNNELHKKLFAYGIAQGFDLSPDKSNDNQLLDLYDKLTKLNADEIMDKFLKEEELVFGDIKLEVDNVSHFLMAISALKSHNEMVLNGKTKAKIKLLIENDSTTSGTAIKLLNLFLNETTKEQLKQVGIFIDKDNTINNRKSDKSNKDIYEHIAYSSESLSNKTKEEIDKIFDNTQNYIYQDSTNPLNTDNLTNPLTKDKAYKVFSYFKDLLPEKEKDGSIPKALRNIFKAPVMTYFYMVGQRSLIGDLSKELLKDFTSKYTKLKHKENLTDKERFLIDNMEKFFNSLKVKYVKGRDKKYIKNKSILELIKENRFDDIILKDYNMSLSETFTNSVGFIYGGTIYQALNKNYQAIRGANVILGMSGKIIQEVYNNVRKEFNVTNIPISKQREVYKNIFSGIVQSPYSSNNREGLFVLKNKTVSDTTGSTSTTVLNNGVYNIFNNKLATYNDGKVRDNKTSVVGTGNLSETYVSTDKAIPVTYTHYTDGSVMASTLISSNGNLGSVHDAIVHQPLYAVEHTYNMNKSMYEVCLNSNPYTDVLNTMKQIYDLDIATAGRISSAELKAKFSLNDIDSMVLFFNTKEFSEFYNTLNENSKALIDNLKYRKDYIRKLLKDKDKNRDKILEVTHISFNDYCRLLKITANFVDKQHMLAKSMNLTVSNIDGVFGTQYNNQKDKATIINEVKSITEQYIEKELIKTIKDKDGNETTILTDKGKKLNPDVLKYFESSLEDDNKILETKLLSDGKARVELFDELLNKSDFKDNSFNKEIRETLSKLNTLRIKDLTVDLIEHISKYGEYDTLNNKIKLSVNDDLNTTNYDNSAVRYAHEVIHAVTAFALENSNRLKIDDEKHKLLYLHQLASKHIKPEDFLPEVSINKERELQEANKIYDYIFNNKDEEYKLRGLNEFIAYALTDERLANKLKEIPIQENRKDKTFGDVLKELVYKIFQFLLPQKDKSLQKSFPNLFNFLSGNITMKDTNVYSSVLNLVNRISIADNNALNRNQGYAEGLKGYIESFKQHTYEPLNTTLSNMLKYATTVGDKFYNINSEVLNTSKENGKFKAPELIKVIAKTIAFSLISSKARNALPSVLSYVGYGSIGETFRGWGTVGRWINEIKGNDDLANVIDDYGQKARKIDQQVKGLEIEYIKVLNEAFKDKNRPNGLNEIEKIALTDVVIKSDLQSLNLSTKEIKELLTNDDKLQEEMDKHLNRIKELSRSKEDYTYYVNSCRLLADYMVNGNINSLTTLTAKEIADRAGTSSRFRSKQEIISEIDKYTSLLALSLTDRNGKELVSSFNEDGLDFFIKSHKSYVEESSKDINDDTYIGRSKGYVRETTNNTHEYKIGLLSDEKSMNLKGFKLVSNQSISNLGKDKLVLYKDGYKYNSHRNGATFMYVGYEKIGTNLFEYLNSEKELIPKKEEVKKSSGKIVKDIENDRVRKTIQIQRKEYSIEELRSIGKDTNGVLSIYDDIGNIVNYNYILPKELKQQVGIDNNGITALSKMNTSLIRRKESLKFNEQLFKYLTIIQDKMNSGLLMNQQTNHRWIEMDTNTPDKFITDVYKSTDSQFKKMIADYKKVNNGKSILIREDLVLDLFGQKDVSIAQKIPRDFYNVRHAVDLAEKITKFVASNFKTLIIIKTPIVLIQNIVSNIMLGIQQGQNPLKLISKYRKGFAYLQSYKTDKTRQQDLIIKQQVSGLSKQEEAELNILNNRITTSPIYPLIRKGLFTNIIDDVDTTDFDNSSMFDKKLDKIRDMIPRPLQIILDTAFVTKHTTLFKFMNLATQYSDFIARFADYEFYMEKGKNLKGKDRISFENRVMDTIVANYINYDKPHSSTEQYLNDMGFLLFTKYFKRIQYVLVRSGIEKPLNTILFLFSQFFLLDTADIFESNMLSSSISNHIYNPLDNLEQLIIPPVLQ